jgi:hypothetical protein
MTTLHYLSHRPDEVLDALRRGEIVALETATEELTDFFVLYALESGLLDRLADTFPDPRHQQPEIPMRLLLAAGMAGHFAGLYALSQSPYALHSPRLLAELGVQVEVMQPGEGLSRKGTHQEVAFHADVLRKMLDTLAWKEQQTGQLPAESLIVWYNQHVGRLFCEAADVEPMLHILDCTDLTVPVFNNRYEGSGISTKHKVVERGYKLGTLRSLLDHGALITGIGWGPLQDHDLTVTGALLRTSVHLRPGDTLLYDRGFLDGADITYLKQERKVDVCTGLKSDMNFFKACVVSAEANPGAWRAHPTRTHQQIQLICGLSGLWAELGVPMNTCVVKKTDPKTGEIEYFCFVTTDLSLSAKQLIELYQTRPEIEEDYRQLKSESWHIDVFHATRQVPILWHVILTLLAYNLFQVYANTKAGREFANKTKQKLQREKRRNPPTYLLVCTRDAYGFYETKSLLYVLLDLPDEVRRKIRDLLPKTLGPPG